MAAHTLSRRFCNHGFGIHRTLNEHVRENGMCVQFAKLDGRGGDVCGDGIRNIMCRDHSNDNLRSDCVLFSFLFFTSLYFFFPFFFLLFLQMHYAAQITANRSQCSKRLASITTQYRQQSRSKKWNEIVKCK